MIRRRRRGAPRSLPARLVIFLVLCVASNLLFFLVPDNDIDNINQVADHSTVNIGSSSSRAHPSNHVLGVASIGKDNKIDSPSSHTVMIRNAELAKQKQPFEPTTITGNKRTAVESQKQQRQKQQQQRPVIELPGVAERVVWRKFQAALEQRLTYQRELEQFVKDVRQNRILSEDDIVVATTISSGNVMATDGGDATTTTTVVEDSDEEEEATIRPAADAGDNTILEAIRSYNEERETNPIPRANCQIPLAASQACHAETYAILAVVASPGEATTTATNRNTDTSSSSNDSTWQRILFVNCLKWMVDPSATTIYVLLPAAVRAEALLESNVAYGRRLLAWHAQTEHPVKLIFGSGLWNALEQFENRQHRNSTIVVNSDEEQVQRHRFATGSDAVLWVSGNQLWRGNRKGLQLGFRLWKQQSASLVSASAWQFQYRTTNRTRVRNNNYDAAGPLRIGAGADARKTSRRRRRLLAASLPLMKRINAIAAQNLLTHQHDDNISLEQQQQQFPVLVDLTMATFHHRNYLCFLQHPVLAKLRADTADDWEAARFGVAAWLSMVAPTDSELRSAGKSQITKARREQLQSEALTKEEALESIASGTFTKDIRFFVISSERNETDQTTLLTVEEKERAKYSDATSPPQLVLDDRKLTVLSMFGGVPPFTDKSVAPRSTSPSRTYHDSC